MNTRGLPWRSFPPRQCSGTEIASGARKCSDSQLAGMQRDDWICARTNFERRKAKPGNIENEIRKLTGKTEVTQADIDQRLADLEQLSKLNDEAAKPRRSFGTGRNRACRESRHRLEETEKNIAALLTEASASNEQEFLSECRNL